jgi:Ca2+-binding EF-hand superfamily protein
MSGFALRGFIALLAVGSCAVAVPGGADKPSGKADGEKLDVDPYAAYRAVFKRLDANGDGTVSEAEYVSRTRWPEAKARAIWRASDADGDGKVTELEYCENRRVTDEAKKIFAWLDANEDGKLTEAEAMAGARRIFAEMDADASGGVHMPECLAARWRWQVDIRWAAKPLVTLRFER